MHDLHLPLCNIHYASFYDDIISIADEAIDFIARKSDDANASSVNKSTETDIEQLTNNLTEYLDRNTVNMSIDFPKEILPGGKIKALPGLKPTFFHPSATLHQKPNALHLSRVGGQMPILSHMFQNISVSTSRDVFNNNSVLNGDGAFINPARASSYMPNSAHNVFIFPTVREINVKNGVIARKLVPAFYEKGDEITHRLTDINSHIEASFNDINNHFDYNVKPTEILQEQSIYEHKKQMTTEQGDQKIFTIFTDVFLIMGSNTVNPDMEMLNATSSNEATFTMPNELNEFIEDKINVEKRPNISTMQDSFPSGATSKNIALIMMTTASAISKPPQPATNSSPGFDLDRLSEKDLRLNIDESSKTSSLAADNMQLNEVIVDMPIQEAVPIVRDVEWINIFNVPQKTIKVHVGNIRNNSGLITDNNKNILTNFRRDKASGNTDLNEAKEAKNRASSISHIAKPGLGLENKQQHYSEAKENNHHQSLANRKSLTEENNSDRNRPKSNIPHNKNLLNILHINSKKMNGIKNTFSNNFGLSPPLQKHDVPRKRLGDGNMSTLKDSTGFLFQESKHPSANPIFDKNPSPLGNQNPLFNRHSNVKLGKGVSISSNSSPRNFNVDSWRKSIPIHQSLRIDENVGSGTLPGSQSLKGGANLGDGTVTNLAQTQLNTGHQPWAFLNKIGVNLSYFDAVNRGSRGFRSNGFMLHTHRQPFQTEQKRTVFKNQNGKTVFPRPQNPRSMWNQRNIIGSRVQLSGPVINDRIPFLPALQMRFNRGRSDFMRTFWCLTLKNKKINEKKGF